MIGITLLWKVLLVWILIDCFITYVFLWLYLDSDVCVYIYECKYVCMCVFVLIHLAMLSLDVNCSPLGPMGWGSVAQTSDGRILVQALRFPTSILFIYFVQP
jgi:hypothetical protein